MHDTLTCLQLFDPTSSTYTYLLWDQKTRAAVIIDPVDTQCARDLDLIKQFDLTLDYILDTHVHGDHITAAAQLKAVHPGARYGMSATAKVQNQDLPLQEGEKISFGTQTLTVIATPGHTDTCLSFHCQNYVFTGDTLLIGGCGRTDFQGGNPETLFDSIQKLYQLQGDTIVYPGHDYRGLTRSTIAWEKRFNKRIPAGQTKAGFKEIMDNLNLATPKKLDEAQKWNVLGGRSPAA